MRKIVTLVYVLVVTSCWAQEPINDSTRLPSPSISYGACIMRDDFEQMVSRKFNYPEGFNGTMELAFDVPTYADVDKEYQHALANGAASVLPPTTEPWGQRTCYVADPDGNLIEIGSFTK